MVSGLVRGQSGGKAGRYQEKSCPGFYLRNCNVEEVIMARSNKGHIMTFPSYTHQPYQLLFVTVSKKKPVGQDFKRPGH